jgi:hypothetical protein
VKDPGSQIRLGGGARASQRFQSCQFVFVAAGGWNEIRYSVCGDRKMAKGVDVRDDSCNLAVSKINECLAKCYRGTDTVVLYAVSRKWVAFTLLLKRHASTAAEGAAESECFEATTPLHWQADAANVMSFAASPSPPLPA